MTDLHPPGLDECNLVRLFEMRSTADHHEASSTLSAKRLVMSATANFEAKLDLFSNIAAACCFVRFTAGGAREVRFVLSGSYRLTSCASGGWLLLPMRDDLASYWVPQAPRLRRLDEVKHVLEERPVEFSDVAIAPAEVSFHVNLPNNWAMDWCAWRFPSVAGGVVDDLRGSLPLERQKNFLWSSHTGYERPADVYLHLIHGHLYENVSRWPKHWKIFSENDAYALYTVLSGLESATGKQLYQLLKDQLLLSVLDRQGDDGGWRHGEWTDRMESHYRLHCSAMHMLMDAFAERNDPAVRKALERAADFLAKQTDTLDEGVWFLHDELEHSLESMRQGPFRWRASRVLGKSEANMLVLNTHLDATIALDRYRQATGDTRHQSLVAQAQSATRVVLSLRPAEWLYRPLFRAIRLTFLPTVEAARLPLYLRALKRLAWKFLIPLLPRIKAHFPRIVMPGGYIDRELSLQGFAHAYLPINLMDLLRYRRFFPGKSVDDVIVAGMALTQDCRMVERWPEIEGKEYAVAFWAEAIYQACLAWPEAKYRVWLAQAVVALEKRSLGLPPSLLGANSEVVAPSDQAPTPVLDDVRIRVVNLSRKDFIEVILVNCSDEAVHPRFLRNAPAGLAWTTDNSSDRRTALPHQIQAGGWLWGRGERRAGAVA